MASRENDMFTLVMVTWLGLAVPMTQEIEYNKLATCNQWAERIEQAWIAADNPDFGYVIYCHEGKLQ